MDRKTRQETQPAQYHSYLEKIGEDLVRRRGKGLVDKNVLSICMLTSGRNRILWKSLRSYVVLDAGNDTSRRELRRGMAGGRQREREREREVTELTTLASLWFGDFRILLCMWLCTLLTDEDPAQLNFFCSIIGAFPTLLA
jgi:hypothetical protein